jgi:hypothetical protein
VVLEQLEKWCFDKAASTEQMDAAAKALREAGYKLELSRIVHHALADSQAHPHVGALWMRRVVSRRRWNGKYPDHLNALCRQGEAGRRAVIEFLETVSARRKHRLIRRVLRKHGRWLRQHPLGWPATARALFRVGYYRKLCHWVSDWRERPDLDLELKYGLALALRTIGREKAAHELVCHALTQPGAAQNYPVLRLWFALEEALAGRGESASDHFNQLDPKGWGQYATGLYCLTRGVIHVQQAEPEGRSEAFKRDYRRIRDRFRVTRIHQCGLLVRREYRRCLWRMARDSGKLGQGFLATWRSADTWWFLLPLVAIPGLQLLLPVYMVRLFTRPRRVAA